MSNGMPYVKWHGRDWLGDPLLRMVGPAERGVWIDLLCAMMNSEPYGHLAVNSRAMTDEEAARMTGLAVDTYKGYLYRLEEVGIPSRTPEGMLFSRRLVRDHALYLSGQKYGRKGGGNPALHVPPPVPPEEESEEVRSQKPEAICARARAYSQLPIKVPYKGTESMPTDGWEEKTVMELAEHPTVSMSPKVAATYFNKRTAAGWIDGAKREVARTMRALRADMIEWKTAEPSHGKTAAGQRKHEPLINTWHSKNPDRKMLEAF